MAGQQKWADHGTASPLGQLAREVAELARAPLDGSGTAAVLWRTVRAARNVMPCADIVSVTLRSRCGAFHTPAWTHPVAVDLDRLQDRHREGPCVDAGRAPEPRYASSDDLATARQWPTFGPAAAAHGVGAVLSTALGSATRPPHLSGALNVYYRSSRHPDDAERELLLMLAASLSVALAAGEAVACAERKIAHLHRAITSRDVIGQAKGILMSQRGITADEAFDVLRRASQEHNVKLVDLAEQVASTRHASTK